MYLDYQPDDLDVTISELLVATSDAADPELPAAVPEVLKLLRYTANLIAARLGQGRV